MLTVSVTCSVVGLTAQINGRTLGVRLDEGHGNKRANADQSLMAGGGGYGGAMGAGMPGMMGNMGDMSGERVRSHAGLLLQH